MLAQVTQTDAAKTPLPQPVATAELDIINNSWAWNANTMVHRDPQGNVLNSFGGAAGEDESSSSAGGTPARGGASTGGVASNAAPQKSSSCGYAVLASERFPGAWPLLGLVLGLAAARRRRARGSAS